MTQFSPSNITQRNNYQASTLLMFYNTLRHLLRHQYWHVYKDLIPVGDRKLKQVDDFQYLGPWIDQSRKLDIG